MSVNFRDNLSEATTPFNYDKNAAGNWVFAFVGNDDNS